jgi:hypothetical protein
MKYKFDQFDAEIENPTIEIDNDSIKLKSSTLMLSVDVTLIVNNARMAVNLDKIPFEYPFHNDSLLTKVPERLNDFEIN